MISYPITDRENRRFTFRDSNGTHRGILWPDGDGNPLSNPAQDLVIMEEFIAPVPAFDIATEKLDSGEWIDDEANQTTTFTQTVISKTAEEQLEYTEEQDIQSNKATLATVISTYQIWRDQTNGLVVQSNIADVVSNLQQLIDHQSQMYRDFAYVLKWLDKRL